MESVKKKLKNKKESDEVVGKINCSRKLNNSHWMELRFPVQDQVTATIRYHIWMRVRYYEMEKVLK